MTRPAVPIQAGAQVCGVWVSCRRCDADDPVPVFRGRDWLLGLPGEFEVVRCRRCGFLYTNPQPDETTLAVHYPTRYHAQPRPSAASGRLRSWLHSGVVAARGYPVAGAGIVRRALGRLAGRLLRQRFLWLPTFVPSGTLVDVGCGTGAYLAKMRELGWSVIGVEPSADAALVARNELGLDVRTGTLEEAELCEGCADVVVMRMVLEHVRDPRRTLTEVRRVLKPGGRLLLSVPNAGSLERRLFGRHWFAWELPRHLVHFTPASLKGLLCDAGLGPVRVHHLVNANNIAASIRYVAGRTGGAVPWQPRPFLPLAVLATLLRQSGRMAAESRRQACIEDAAAYYRWGAGPDARSSTELTQRAVASMLERISPVSGPTVDLGCGSGSNLASIRRAATGVLCLDISKAALEEARERDRSVDVAVADARSLPLCARSVGLVVCSEVLEHVPQLGPVICEISRVLEPGGWLVVTTPSYLNPMGLRKLRRDRVLGGRRWEPWGAHEGGMERFMTPHTLERALADRFEVLDRFGIDHYTAWLAPLNLTASLGNRPFVRALLDERLGRLPLLRSTGMHYCLLATRRP